MVRKDARDKHLGVPPTIVETATQLAQTLAPGFGLSWQRVARAAMTRGMLEFQRELEGGRIPSVAMLETAGTPHGPLLEEGDLDPPAEDLIIGLNTPSDTSSEGEA